MEPVISRMAGGLPRRLIWDFTAPRSGQRDALRAGASAETAPVKAHPGAPIGQRLPQGPASAACSRRGRGLLLLHALDAHSAVRSVVVGVLVLVVPVAWARRGIYPGLAAVAAPLLMLVPPLTSWLSAASLSGRNCVWRSWSAGVREDPLWGLGAPGHLEDTCPNPVFIVNAHNELLQSWSVGGLLGLSGFPFLGFFTIVAWMAVRHSDLEAASSWR